MMATRFIVTSIYIVTINAQVLFATIDSRQMARLYDLDCPVAKTLEMIGERWTILILRDLLRQKTRRFQDFADSFPKLAPTTLSARLKQLEAGGIVERRLYAEHPPRAEYLLTEKGKALGPILASMKSWGERYGG